MDSLNTNYYVELEILSPVHIGTEQEKIWQQNLDFKIKDGKLQYYHLDKLLKNITNIKAVDEALARGNFKSLMTGTPDLVFYFPYTQSQNGIRPLIRTGGGNPFIPGSSLKGAIRSILFTYLRKKMNSNTNRLEDIFGRIQNNLMRFLRVTDAEFQPTDTKIFRTKIFNIFKELKGKISNFSGGWKHSNETNEEFNSESFVTDYEVFQIGKKATLRIGVAENFHQSILNQLSNIPNKNELLKNSQFDLFKIINEHTRRYINKEISFLTKYKDAEHIHFVISQLEDIRKQIPTNNANFCILKLGAGSGFHSITGDWQHNDFTSLITEQNINRKNAKKTRKIAFEEFGDEIEMFMMGFVKLTKKSILKGGNTGSSVIMAANQPKEIIEAQIVEIDVNKNLVKVEFEIHGKKEVALVSKLSIDERCKVGVKIKVSCKYNEKKKQYDLAFDSFLDQ